MIGLIRRLLGSRTARFGIVGISATLSYVLITAGLEYLTGLPSALINAIGLAGSLLLSYAGHYYFTFEAKAGHGRKGPLFLVITAVIVLGAMAVQQVTELLLASPYASYLAVTVYYPVASFVLHNLVTFRRA